MIIFQPVPVRAPSYVARSLYHRARWQAQRRDGSPQLLLAAACEAAPVVMRQLPLIEYVAPPEVQACDHIISRLDNLSDFLAWALNPNREMIAV